VAARGRRDAVHRHRGHPPQDLGLLFGITIAGANALTQLMFLGVYPAWSIAVMVVDGLIIYALTTHIEEFD